MADKDDKSGLIFDLENGSGNPCKIDKIGTTIDVKSTSTNGIFAQVAEKLIYKYDSLEGIDYWKGQILRVEESSKETEANSAFSFLAKIFDNKIYKCKVRIPGLHDCLPIPSTFDENKSDKGIIDQYPTFIYDPYFPFFDSLVVGDIVTIEFGNSSDFTSGKIITKVGSKAKPVGTGPINSDNTGGNQPGSPQPPANPSAPVANTFNDKPAVTQQQANPPATVQPEPKDGYKLVTIRSSGSGEAHFSYSTKLDKAPLIIVLGGIRSRGAGTPAITWSHGLGLEKTLPSSVKEKTFIFYLEYDGFSSPKSSIAEARQLCEKYGKTATEVKLLGFSGGGNTAVGAFFRNPELYTMLGLMDPSLGNYPKVTKDELAKKLYKEQKIFMTYRLSNWSEKLKPPIKYFADLLGIPQDGPRFPGGGGGEDVNHGGQPKFFFQKYADQITAITARGTT